MTTLAWTFLAVAGAFAVSDWLAVARSNKRAEYVCKPAAIVFLIAVALSLHSHLAARRVFSSAILPRCGRPRNAPPTCSL